MSDLSHDPTDDGFHEIQLSGKQLVFLFMATTVVAVVIFLCGVLVGRAVPARGSDLSQAVEAAAAPPPAEPAPQTAAVPAPEPPVPPADEEKLTYQSRLERETPPAEELKPADPPKSAPAPARAEPALPKASHPAPAAAAPTAGQGARPGTWVVQLAALRDPAAASSIVTRLTGKGYPAFIVNPSAGAPTPVYKVQVGRFAEKSEAEQVKRRLEQEEKFSPWISR